MNCSVKTGSTDSSVWRLIAMLEIRNEQERVGYHKTARAVVLGNICVLSVIFARGYIPVILGGGRLCRTTLVCQECGAAGLLSPGHTTSRQSALKDETKFVLFELRLLHRSIT